MAREMTKKARPFKLENSDVIEENERILEAGSLKRKENKEAEPAATVSTPASTPAPTAQNPVQELAHTDTPTNRFDLQQGKKTANGIVVNVPMDDYMQLTMMKFQTGRTLKDLALQAIHEFIERNK